MIDIVKNYCVSGAIVMYNNDAEMLRKAINSFLATSIDVKLYLVDNSPSNALSNICNDERCEYIHNIANTGFGAGHNIAIAAALKAGSDYHFIINPDVYFDDDVIVPMINYMHSNTNTGMLMPKVLNTDGTIQNLPKLLPSPISVLLRKLKKPRKIYDEFINNYELRFVPEDRIYKAPVISGCFTLLNLNAIKDVGGYDDNFFMYFEDWDLSRRIAAKYDTIYFPKVSVYHEYESGANKNLKLFKVFIKSAITYFNKWGWFIDKERKKLNEETLIQFK